jgi:serpin B
MFRFGFGSAREADPLPAGFVVENNTAFALELCRELGRTPGNLFFSPYSISICLAIAYAGARGETAKQMGRVLHLDAHQGRVHAAFAQLQRLLRDAIDGIGCELSVANGVWKQQGHPFLPAFLEVARQQYQANVKEADFVTGAEAAREEINRWVAQETKEKIQQVLPPGSLNDITLMVLANAIYFKGAWAQPFEESESSVLPFYISRGRQVDALLMHQVKEVRYAEQREFQAIEMLYRYGRLSMVVLLPREVDGCGLLENRLSPNLLARALGQMKRREVEIFLPRFKIDSGFDLNATLGRMGMPNAFELTADFSGMSRTKPLFVSGVFHKAWGEVNEAGTEAAAATVMAMAGCCDMEPPPPPPVFRADHPFVFLIRDTRSGSVLFVGRLAEPRRG